MPRQDEIAWAAGLFEGEGCFTVQVRHDGTGGGASVRAQLTMTDEEPVRRFAEIVGVGVLRPKRATQPQHTDQLVWRVTNRAGVEYILDLFAPWLGQRRLARGREVLRLQTEAIAQRIPRCLSWTGTRNDTHPRCLLDRGHDGPHSFEK